jgi:glycosyltransferase involved in cell wall biosynthesis
VSGQQPIRVLFVESQTELGGAQFALLTMLESLDRAKIAPVYASLEFGHGDFPERVEALGIRVYRIPGGRFRELWSSWVRIRCLRKLIQKEKIELVLSNNGHPLLYARPAALWARRPCVWWSHGYFSHDPRRRDLIGRIQLFLAADDILANSEYTARSLRAVYGPRRSIRVARCGTDLMLHRPAPKEGAEARRQLGIEDRELVAGIFGRLQQGKGQHVFLRAAAELARRGIAARYLVVGGSLFGLEPEYAPGLRRLVEESGLSDRVEFLGQRADTNALMNACDVVVLASIEPETWGLVLAEAMAAGCAVIGVAAGGPLEMIVDEQMGLLTPPNDVAALADAMESLLQQPKRRRALGKAARKHAEEHFDRFCAATVMCNELRRSYEAHAART